MGIRVGGGLINPSFKLISNKGLTDTITWSDSTSIFAYANAAYSYQYTARSSLGNPVTYSVTNGSLPAALTLTSTGLLSGHVNAVVANTSFTYTVEASDGSASQNLTFDFTAIYNPAPVWSSNSNLGAFSERANIALQLAATDIYDRTITYSVANGALPSGVTVASNGLVQGQMPEVSSNTAYTFGVAASNGYESNTQTFQLEVLDAHVYWNAFTGVTNGVQYYDYPSYLSGQTFDSANTIVAHSTIGNPLYYYCANSAIPGDNTGVLPSGLTLDSSTGLLSGTLPSTGSDHTYGFEIIVEDTVTGSTANEYFYIPVQVSVAPTWVSPNAGIIFSGVGGIGTSYSIELQATANDFEPVEYSIISGILPVGGTFNSNTGNGNASVSGTLASVGSTTDYTFVVSASDGVNASTRSFTIVNEANEAPVWNTNAGSLGSGYESKPFSTTLSATDINGLTVTYALANATSLPSGMTLSNTGTITGSFPAVANAQAGNVVYDFTISANNGTLASNRDFSLTDMPVLPPVWTSNSLGTHYANAFANIALPVSDPQNFSMTFSTVSGTAPAGLTYGPGYMTGNFTTTAQSVVYSWTARANDGVHYSDEALTATVQYLAPIWSTAPGSLGTYYENANLGIFLNATDPNGGLPTYALANGSSLPSGLILDNISGVGEIHGQVGVVSNNTTYNFSISANNAQASVEAFSLTVLYSATPTWVTAAGDLGYFYLNSAVNQTLVANSATGNPLSYTVTIGSLPPGLSLANSTGVISGMLGNTIGNYSFSVTATDTLSQKFATEAFTMEVVSNSQPIWNLSSPQNYYVYANTPINIPLSITNPTGVSYSVTNGTLPSAVTITNDANFAAVTTLIHADDALGSTTVADTSGYNTFTLANASISYANQKFGVGSINTANAGAVVTSSQKEANGVNFGTGAFTLEAWIYPESLGQDLSTGTAYVGGSYVGSILNITGNPSGNARGILDWNISGPAATGNATCIGLQSYDPTVFATNAIVDIYANAVIPTNQWTHVAVARSGGSVTFFVNGVQQSTVYSLPFTSATSFTTVTNSVIQLGGINGVSPFAQNLGGYIDEIRITNGVSRYVNSFSPQTASYPTYVSLQGDYVASNGTSNSFTLVANNAGLTANLAINLHAVNSFPTWTSNTTLTSASARQPYSAYLSGVTDPEGYTDFTYTNTSAMPFGLSLAANGLVSGNAPFANGSSQNYTFQAKASNPVGPSVTQTITLPVNPVGITWNTSANIGTFTVNSAISNVSLSVTDLNDSGAVITYTVANATSLPSGLTLSNGVISGTPAAVANTAFVLEAADIYNAVAYKSFYTNVIPGTISFGTTAYQWTVNTAIANTTLSFTNTDHAPVNTVVSNATTLPTGLSLSNNVLSGAPTVIANTSFTIHATDTYGASTYQNFNAVVWTPAITWSDSQTPSGYETAYYSYQLTASNGQPLTYSLANGALPASVTLASNGLVSGVLANTVNVANYTILATDGHQSATRSFSFSTLNAAPVWTTAPALGTYASGTMLNVQLQANTVLTNAPITYTQTGGTLPSGITLSNSGLLSGTLPIETSATGFGFTIAATANTLSTPQTFSLTVSAGLPTWVSNASLSGYYERAASYHLVANSPSNFPLNYSISNGSLPGNLTIGNDPYWSNVATLLHFDDASNATTLFDPTGLNTWTLTNANIATSPAKFGNAVYLQGNAVAAVFTNTQTNPANANFAGNPFTLESWIYPISWGNDGAATAPSNGGTIVALTTGIGSGNNRGSWNFFAAGNSQIANATTLNMQGWNTTSFSSYPIIDVYANATIPLNQWSHVAVTRSNATTFNFFLNGTLLTTATRTNSGNTPALTANSVFMYGVNSSLQIGGIGSNNFDTAWVGYMDELRVTSNVARYTTSFTPQTTEYVANGYMTSLVLNATPGSYTFTTRATDNTGIFADQVTTLNVSASPITWTDSQNPSGYETSYYSYQLTANNGLPITYTLNSGSLPANLTLASNGLVSGALSNTVNTANYVIAASDTYQTVTRSFSFATINAAPTWVSNSNLGTYGDAAAVNTQLVATTVLSNAPLSYTVTGGALPSGVTLSNTGLLSGTLPGVSNATGYSFTVTATANTLSTPQTFALSEGGATIVWTSNANLTATHAVKTDFPLSATDTGGNYPITYSIANGSLPTGYSVNYGSNVTAMLHFEDAVTNTVITDSSGVNTYKAGPGGKLSNAVVKFGNGALFGNGTITPGWMANSQTNPVGVMFGTAPMTMEAWVYPQSLAQDNNFSGQLNRIGPIMTLYETNAGGARGVLNFYLAGSVSNVVTSVGFWGYVHGQSNGSTPANFDSYANTTAVTMNAWNHIAVSRVGANINFFVNGVKQTTQYRTNVGSGSGTTPVFSSTINIPDANTNLAVTSIQIGGWSGGSGAFNEILTGYVDEFRITNGVAQYTANFTPIPYAFVPSDISGSNSTTGTYTFTAKATDSIGGTANQVTTITIV